MAKRPGEGSSSGSSSSKKPRLLRDDLDRAMNLAAGMFQNQEVQLQEEVEEVIVEDLPEQNVQDPPPPLPPPALPLDPGPAGEVDPYVKEREDALDKATAWCDNLSDKEEQEKVESYAQHSLKQTYPFHFDDHEDDDDGGDQYYEYPDPPEDDA